MKWIFHLELVIKFVSGGFYSKSFQKYRVHFSLCIWGNKDQ